VLLPAHNEADLDDIPADLRKQMQLVLVESIDQVLKEALAPARVAGRAASSAVPVPIRSNGAGKARAAARRGVKAPKRPVRPSSRS
jgi:hypothetical protein